MPVYEAFIERKVFINVAFEANSLAHAEKKLAAGHWALHREAADVKQVLSIKVIADDRVSPGLAEALAYHREFFGCETEEQVNDHRR